MSTDDLNILGGMITPAPMGGGVPAYFDTGMVTEVVDATHIKVDLGDKQVICHVPQVGMLQPAVGAAVQVCVQENTYILAAILSGGTLAPIAASQLPLATSTAHGAMSSQDWVKLASATSTNETSRIVMRDAAGRAQFTSPSFASDVAIKSYVDARAGGRPFGHMGRTAGFQTNVNGVVGMDSAQELRGGMTFSNSNDALVIPEDGLYMVNHRAYWTGGTLYLGPSRAWVNGAELIGSYVAGWKEEANDYMFFMSVCHELQEGDTVAVHMASPGSVGSTWGTTGYNGTFVEVIALF